MSERMEDILRRVAAGELSPEEALRQLEGEPSEADLTHEPGSEGSNHPGGARSYGEEPGQAEIPAYGEQS